MSNRQPNVHQSAPVSPSQGTTQSVGASAPVQATAMKVGGAVAKAPEGELVGLEVVSATGLENIMSMTPKVFTHWINSMKAQGEPFTRREMETARAAIANEKKAPSK